MKAQKRGVGKRKKGGPPKRGGDTVKGGGQTLDGLNRRAGQCIWRYRCDGDYRLAPKCPWRHTPRGGGGSFPRGRDRTQRPAYFAISMETPVLAQNAEHLEDGEAEGKCEQSSSATMDMGE